MIFRLIDSRIIAAISPEVRSRQHIRDPAAAISATDHRRSIKRLAVFLLRQSLKMSSMLMGSDMER
jgi:hypothetical protein